jgi:uncharacterized membrane protein YhaH (DUF805 family)
VQATGRFFGKYATFSGRASRSEYWWPQLVFLLGYLLLGVVTGIGALATSGQIASSDSIPPGAVPGVILIVVAGFALIVPNIAVSVRRLHDGGFSGWLYLLALVPYLGGLVILVFMVLPSRAHGARYDRP